MYEETANGLLRYCRDVNIEIDVIIEESEIHRSLVMVPTDGLQSMEVVLPTRDVTYRRSIYLALDRPRPTSHRMEAGIKLGCSTAFLCVDFQRAELICRSFARAKILVVWRNVLGQHIKNEESYARTMNLSPMIHETNQSATCSTMQYRVPLSLFHSRLSCC